MKRAAILISALFVSLLVAASSQATAGPQFQWMQLSPAGGPPAARAGHSAVWDEVNNQMLVFAGHPGTGVGSDLDDLWSYSPATNSWSQKATGPSQRNSSCAVWDSQNGRMLIFGGGFFVDLNDLWAYDPASDTWTQLNPTGGPPPGRDGHACVWDSQNNQLLVFAGRTGATLSNDLWAYRPASNNWVALSPLPAGPRWGLTDAAVWDPLGNRMLVFGGSVENVGPVNELWSYSPAADSWTLLTPAGAAPAARTAHSSVWASPINCMLIFGGRTAAGDVNDVWQYCPQTNQWTQISVLGTPPSPRRGATAVWDTQTDRMLIFGGDDGYPSEHRLNDLWALVPPGVGGIVELPSGPASPASSEAGSASGDYAVPIAAAVVVGVIATALGGWYAGRRWLRR